MTLVGPGTHTAYATANSPTTLDTGYQYVPAVAVSPTYDDDGNLLTDGRFTYTWDGENRLKGISWTAPGNTPARIAYTYDGYSRRVLKQEFRTSGGIEYSIDYIGFIYDGWNHVMTVRLNTNNTPVGRVASYVWGPDVGSGYGEYAGHQKAGGVGGLCLVLDGSTTSYYNPYYGTINDLADDDYFPLMDRMGNVTGYRKAATTEAADSLSAVYEYDAFGQEIRSVGPASDTQPYRFSTKFTEGSTGLVYYGFRWYDAGKGRWVNRDPIGEEGGVNLYGMVGNNIIWALDILGEMTLRLTNSDQSVKFGAEVVNKMADVEKKLSEAIANDHCATCVQVLELHGHGSEKGVWIGAEEDGGTKLDDTNVDVFAKTIAPKLCSGCIILLSACNTGLAKGDKDWVQRLSNGTGCQIIAPEGYCNGPLSWKNNEIDKGNAGFPPRPGGQDEKVAEFNPYEAPVTLNAALHPSIRWVNSPP
jgi:RHS repeat-associated protein